MGDWCMVVVSQGVRNKRPGGFAVECVVPPSLSP